jgi:hypothetical protein
MADKFNLNDTTPAAPGGRINIVWQSDTNGNISAHIPPGSQTPWTQNVDAAGFALNYAGTIGMGPSTRTGVITVAQDGATDSGAMTFSTRNLGALAERVRIAAGGNVGIGTAAPTSKLHVVGLPSYADNAAALAGGLTAGAFYHTAGVVKVVI